MSSPDIREPTSEELAAIEERLRQFREKFATWSGMTHWDLLDFARYEGVAGVLEDEIEPVVLGAKCVSLHGCRWCMLRVGNAWHFAICHDSLLAPIDLSNFNKKRLKQTLSERWRQRLFGRGDS